MVDTLNFLQPVWSENPQNGSSPGIGLENPGFGNVILKACFYETDNWNKVQHIVNQNVRLNIAYSRPTSLDVNSLSI